MSLSFSSYEPRPQMPLTLRGVITPGNNPGLFKERQRLAREAKARVKVPAETKGMMKPGGESLLPQGKELSLTRS